MLGNVRGNMTKPLIFSFLISFFSILRQSKHGIMTDILSLGLRSHQLEHQCMIEGYSLSEGPEKNPMYLLGKACKEPSRPWQVCPSVGQTFNCLYVYLPSHTLTYMYSDDSLIRAPIVRKSR